jgi:hypothetical protein
MSPCLRGVLRRAAGRSCSVQMPSRPLHHPSPETLHGLERDNGMKNLGRTMDEMLVYLNEGR